MKAFAYMRTSSATNVDGDSSERQRVAIRSYADRNDIQIVQEFYDAAVSGADPIDRRPGFIAMLASLNGARTILVENAQRFARDLMVQEIGYKYLKDQGITLIAVDRPEQFEVSDDPMVTAFRQIVGVLMQLDKAMTVSKLKGARDRKSRELGQRVEGNSGYEKGKPHEPEFARWARTEFPELPGLAVSIRAKKPKCPLTEIASKLAMMGYTRTNGEPYLPGTVARWVS